MIDVNSNCSRVDAVKATENQLKMQLAQAPKSFPESDAYRKAQSQIQTLDQQIQHGDAQKAELALSTAKNSVQELNTQTAATTTSQGSLNTFA